MNKRVTFILIMLAALAGCAGPASRTIVETENADQLPVNWAEVEDFDASAYAERQPEARAAVEHEAPVALLAGTLGERGAPGKQAGFRIQILATQNRAEADQAAAEAVAWWQRLQANGALDKLYPWLESEPPIYQDFRAPFYRVRLGNFAVRAHAERMLPVVEDRYASAFIAPDRIVVR